ncbi:MAG TPA: (d)CMP kinase, partial [Candidatus Dojkabacteria bacterium]|nr:(d)CMP kinase [Candidatus Dojkabacteria bacterium]
NFTHISSGNLYRYISLIFALSNITNDQVLQNKSIIENIDFNFNSANELLIDGRSIEEDLRNDKVNEVMIWVNQIYSIREKVNSTLRNLAKTMDLVVDGRDMGSQVFPKADYKFFFYAPTFQRAAKFYSDPEQISKLARKLDLRDKEEFTRKVNPLIRPENSFEVNPFSTGIPETIILMTSLISMRMNGFSNEEFTYSGIFSRDESNPDILFINNVKKATSPEIINKVNVIITNSTISKESHLYQYIRDFGVSVVQNTELSISTVNCLEGKHVTILSKEGRAKIIPFGINSCKEIPKDPKQIPNAVLVSNKRGMEKYSEYGITTCALRAEFILHNYLSKGTKFSIEEYMRSIEDTLLFASSHFELTIFRFSDLSAVNLNNTKMCLNSKLFEERDLGKRGLATLLDENRILLDAEIGAVARIEPAQKGKFQFLLPFPTNKAEIFQTLQIIENSGINNPVGLMIETPYILQIASEIQDKFDFFVIGTSDLLQLYSGSTRDNALFSSDVSQRLADLIHNTFVCNLRNEKKVYIPNSIIYQRVTTKMKSIKNIIFLKKY